MKCPHDNVDLVMTERQGIEIDYCPTCRGVWLDRGELDKIIERAAPGAGAAPSVPPAAAPVRDAYPDRGYGYGERGERGYGERGEYGEHGEYGERGERGYGYGRRRKSFLGELFDF